MLMDRLQPHTGQRYLVREQYGEEIIGDIGEEKRQMVTEVKIVLQVSHNAMPRNDEYLRWTPQQ